MGAREIGGPKAADPVDRKPLCPHYMRCALPGGVGAGPGGASEVELVLSVPSGTDRTDSYVRGDGARAPAIGASSPDDIAFGILTVGNFSATQTLLAILFDLHARSISGVRAIAALPVQMAGAAGPRWAAARPTRRRGRKQAGRRTSRQGPPRSFRLRKDLGGPTSPHAWDTNARVIWVLRPAGFCWTWSVGQFAPIRGIEVEC